MKLRFHYILAAVAIMSIAACTKSDDNTESISQSYGIKLSSFQVYKENRYPAVDSLMDFITSNMGLEKDTIPNSWLVEGANLDACDKELVSRFDKACALVDAEQYGGKYTVCASRKGSEGKSVIIASKEFTATADNDGQEDIGRTIQPRQEGFYIYDIGISSNNKLDPARSGLENAGFTVIDGDLNKTGGGYYILVGIKYGTAETMTGIIGKVTNDYTGLEEVRELTAKEAAISKVVCLQSKEHPETFKGPKNDATWGNATFERLKHFSSSNGDTNQSITGDPSFLYFTRHNNWNQYISQMYYVKMKYNTGIDKLIYGSTSGFKNDDLVQATTYYSWNGRCSIIAGIADLNKGTKHDYTYIGCVTIVTNK